MEKWVVQADKDDDHKIHVRVLSGVHFVKNVMLRGTIQKSVEAGSAKVYFIWRKKFLRYGVVRRGVDGAASDGDNDSEDQSLTEGAAEESTLSSFVRKVTGCVSSCTEILIPLLSILGKVGAMLFLIWWMMNMLWTLDRIAQAMEMANRLQ
jgi:hypothetical protein